MGARRADSRLLTLTTPGGALVKGHLPAPIYRNGVTYSPIHLAYGEPYNSIASEKAGTPVFGAAKIWRKK